MSKEEEGEEKMLADTARIPSVPQQQQQHDMDPSSSSTMNSSAEPCFVAAADILDEHGDTNGLQQPQQQPSEPETTTAARAATVVIASGGGDGSQQQQPARSPPQQQQTRFSFYNAEEFKVRGTPTRGGGGEPAVIHPSHSSGHSATSEPETPKPAAQQPQRFNFYNAQEISLTQTVVETVEAQQQPCERSEPRDAARRRCSDSAAERQPQHDQGEQRAAASAAAAAAAMSASLDSGDILKSLQEHEQQRLEILGAGPSSSLLSRSSSAGTGPHLPTQFSGGSGSSGSTPNNSGAVNATTTGNNGTNNFVDYYSMGPHSHSAAGSANNNSNNPYEDAIKEALQLLRKHRSSSSSVPGQPTSSSSPSSSRHTPRSLNNSRTTNPSIMNDSGSIISANNNNSNTAVGLGEAYQAEIEARRKQRQERMARYASRLAELKHDTDDDFDSGGVALQVGASRSLDSSVDYQYNNSSNNSRSRALVLDPATASNQPSRQQPQQQQQQWAINSRLKEFDDGDAQNVSDNDDDDDMGPRLSQSWDADVQNHHHRYAIPTLQYYQGPPHRYRRHGDAIDDAIVAQRSEAPDEEEDDDNGTTATAPHEIAPSLSNAEGSLSTLSNTQHRQDEEVQRGVERVLLAILERANHSRGRASASNHSLGGGDNISSSAATEAVVHLSSQRQQQPLSPDEEKKSSTSLEDLQQNHNSPQQQQQQFQGDALLRAMSEILGPSSALAGHVVSPPRTTVESEQILIVHDMADGDDDDDDDNDDDHEEENPSLATQEEDHSTAVPTGGSSAEALSSILNTTTTSSTDASSEQQKALSSILDVATSSTALELQLQPKPPPPAPGTVSSATSASAHDELDRMVERVFQQQQQQQQQQRYSTEDSEEEEDDDNNHDDDSYERKPYKRHSDDSDESSSDFVDDDDDDDRSEEDEDSFDDGSSEEEDDDVYETDDKYKRKVLGPRNRRSGGTTGVVLEDDSSSSVSSGDNDYGSPPSILESLSAAVSLVTGGANDHTDNNSHSDRLAGGGGGSDKYALHHHARSDDDFDSNQQDSEAHELMRSLCAHLLPVGVDRSSRLLERRPEWDESNPDETGYRIVRLSKFQLRRIQQEYTRMVDQLKRKSEHNLTSTDLTANDDSTFERDLREAEDLLDQEEMRLKTAQTLLHTGQAAEVTSVAAEETGDDSFGDPFCSVHETLPAFPGVKATGNGEMGELEYFCLPVIYKSHVTGFEPTKDLILEPGNVVAGQYLVEGILGSAAFSTAYKCIDLTSPEDSTGAQEEVCLKVIKNTKDFFDQSLDEIKILELLRQTGKCHENYILEMKTFFYHREHLIIVTELLRQNLFEFGKFIIDSGEEPYFTMPRLSYIIRQCLVSLRFVHSLGLVHSDLKPENILLASYSRAKVKIIDFGSSCYLTDRQSSYIQSRSYRAPEVVLGLPYDGRIDIWSLGCVMAEMFTGEVTFQNDSIVSMLSRIEAICGPFPRHMIAQGRQSPRFFTKCGLLFEKVDQNDSMNNDSYTEEESSGDDENTLKMTHIDVFQPKRTTMAARLGFSLDLMDKFDAGMHLSKERERETLFVDLVRKLLTIDPEIRPTAAEALEHPLMQYAATLTEDDVKYPSS